MLGVKQGRLSALQAHAGSLQAAKNRLLNGSDAELGVLSRLHAVL